MLYTENVLSLVSLHLLKLNEDYNVTNMYLDIDDAGIIRDVKFKTFGCGAAIATSSMATELIKGKSIEEALELTNKAVVEALDGLPPQKIHCSVLAEEAVKKAIANYYDKMGIEHDIMKGCDGCCDHCHHHHNED